LTYFGKKDCFDFKSLKTSIKFCFKNNYGRMEKHEIINLIDKLIRNQDIILDLSDNLERENNPRKFTSLIIRNK